MRMLVYACSEEEEVFFRRWEKTYHAELTLAKEKPAKENVSLAQGVDVINILSDTVITPELLKAYCACGVRMIVSRTIGVEHIDLRAAAAAGIAVSNVTYSPASVADYAIMMMLMLLRRVKPMLAAYAAQDYTARALRGEELPEKTVGIVGLGRIGATTARHLSGFECRVLGWNRTPLPEIPGVEQTGLNALLRRSDIVSLHLASNAQTQHFVDAHFLEQMKPGAILINTARGPLVDSAALIKALESGHLSGAGLDVFDGDRRIYYRDFKNERVQSHEMAILNAMPNVLMLPHMAYYTDRASEDMVRNSLESAALFLQGKESPWRII